MGMFDHVQIKVKNYKESREFYEAVLSTLGYKVVLEFNSAFGIGNDIHNMFEVSQADEERPLSSGLHIAFKAKSEEDVRKFYQKAIELGATDNGAPGLRPEYGEGYYSAFFIDADSHNIEAVFMRS